MRSQEEIAAWASRLIPDEHEETAAYHESRRRLFHDGFVAGQKSADPLLLKACENYAFPALNEVINHIHAGRVDAIDLMSLIHARDFIAAIAKQARGAS